MGVRSAVIALLVTLAASAAGAQQDAIWSARLWLTAPAFGLEEDCPVAVLFRDPPFRTAGTGASAARLVSSEQAGDRLVLVIDTPGLDPSGGLSRVTLDLVLHRAQGIVSVDRIRRDGPGGPSTLTYAEAVDDDDDYDAYTNTLVALYQAWFDPLEIKTRVAIAPAG